MSIDYGGVDRRRGGPDRRNTGDKIRVLLVDNHALFRVGMRNILEREQDFVIVGPGGIPVDAKYNSLIVAEGRLWVASTHGIAVRDAGTWHVLGTAEGLEARLVPQAGYQMEIVPRVPLPRHPGTDLVRLPGRLTMK